MTHELYETILKRGKLPARDLAVDAATGSGQAAKGLSPYFAKVVALDHDSEQLKHAPHLPNVTFKLGAAEDTGLENNTADVIAVAAGLHWFDHDKFYPEAHRILKPGGCLAAWGYDLMTFPENKRAQEELHKLFTFTLGPYWHPRVDHVWQHYKDIEPPQALFSSQHVQLKVDTTMTLSALVGLVSTWSAYNSYRGDRPCEPDPLIDFQERFLQAAQLSSPDEKFRASYPLFLMLCSSHS